MLKKTSTVVASKENAVKARRLVGKLLMGGKLNEDDACFLTEFLDRTIGRLPTENAIAKDRQRAKNKATKT